jgi:lipoprotein NlpI
LRNPCILIAITFLISSRPAFAAPTADELLASARHALDRHDKDEALKLADKALEADAKNTEAYVFRARLHDIRREFDKAIIDYGKVIELSPEAGLAWQRRGEDHFRLGHFKESVADFDKVIALSPGDAPHHWQRGISLYYAGEFDRGAKQFELHKTVNPQDVENAVWHFLCVARLSGVEKARQSLIPIRDDGRVPMMQIFALFGGKATEQTVMEAVNAGNPPEAVLKERLFYAHLYLGLFDEANGKLESAKEHISLAAGKYAEEDYMGDVARVHAMVLKVGK